MKRRDTYHMLRQLAQFVRQRRRQVIGQWLATTDATYTPKASAATPRPLQYSTQSIAENIEELIHTPVTSPSVCAVVTSHSGKSVVVCPTTEFVQIFRDLEQVRKGAFAVWWASRNVHTETAMAA